MVKVTGAPAGLPALASIAVNVCIVPTITWGTTDGERVSRGPGLVGDAKHDPSAFVTFTMLVDCVA
jgi:hypothetical protein